MMDGLVFAYLTILVWIPWRRGRSTIHPIFQVDNIHQLVSKLRRYTTIKITLWFGTFAQGMNDLDNK